MPNKRGSFLHASWNPSFIQHHDLRVRVALLDAYSIDDTTARVANIQSVKLERTVLGFTRASILAMFVEIWM